MEKVILNPGYHYVAQKILNNLNSQSLFALSQTNKEIMKVCERFIVAKERKQPIFENLKCKICEEVFTDTFRDYLTFVKANEICHIGFFKSVTAKEEDKEHILVRYLEKLSKVIKVNRYSLLKRLTLHNGRCGNRIHLINETLYLFVQKYVQFIPSGCPVESKKHLLMILNQAVCWEELEMVKTLLAALKNQDTCLRLTISAMSSNSYIIYKNDMTFIEKIATKCKNPNAPNKSGSTAMHLVAKLGLDKVATILLPYCKNLGQRDQDRKTALDIAIENENYETMTIIKDAIVRRALSI